MTASSCYSMFIIDTQVIRVSCSDLTETHWERYPYLVYIPANLCGLIDGHYTLIFLILLTFIGWLSYFCHSHTQYYSHYSGTCQTKYLCKWNTCLLWTPTWNTFLAPPKSFCISSHLSCWNNSYCFVLSVHTSNYLFPIGQKCPGAKCSTSTACVGSTLYTTVQWILIRVYSMILGFPCTPYTRP